MNDKPASVTRYVATYVNAHGERVLMRPAQGRNTFDGPMAAQEWLEAVTQNNSRDTIRQIWGDDPQFEIRPCPCWPGHFDPQTRYFD